MPVHHNVEQGSEAWDRLRLGIPTASEFKKLITGKTRRESVQWQDYAYHLLAERILMRPEDHYVSEPMWTGKIRESEAALWYEMDQDVDTQTIGFISSDEFISDIRGYQWFRYGASPDRLVGDNGILEIKCATPRVHLKQWFEPRPDREHWPQLQGQLFVTQREWVDILFFHDELSSIVIRVERDETFIRLLEASLRQFNEFLDGLMDKIGSLQPAAPRLTPREQLRQMLDASLKDDS